MSLTLSQRALNAQPSVVREILKIAERPEVLSFAGGLPAPELFPVEALAAAHAEVFRSQARSALQYAATEGVLPLRQWIVDRLRHHGMSVDVDTCLITAGSQQGIDLASRVLIDPGTAVLVEDPSYLAALQAFHGYEAHIVTVPSDQEGMRTDLLEAICVREKVRVIYLVPCFQNPKGTTLSLPRRLQLLDVAARHGIAVIEDDPYGELRFRGEHIKSLAALDTEGVVVRLGSFSKTLAPGLRLGFATGAKDVIRAMTVAKQACDLQTATLAQRAVATLLQTFDYEAHLEMLRRVYGERCQTMLDALTASMPEGTKWTDPEGGMFIWLQLPDQLRAEDLFPLAIAERVAFVPGSGFFAGEKHHDFMRLNFSNCGPDAIREGMGRLAKVVATAQAAKREGHSAPPSLAAAG
jgi:2-aminoadipate transaminase